MAEPVREVPEGAAVLPEIPEELMIHPLLLAVLHSAVFIAGSDESIVQSAAAEEAMSYVGVYLRRLNDKDLERVQTDLAVLADFARQQGWDQEDIDFFRHFLDDFGVGKSEQSEST